MSFNFLHKLSIIPVVADFWRENPPKTWCLHLLLSGCLLWMGSSCGYRFVGSDGAPLIDGGLFINLLENRTTETGVELLITDHLKDEFIQKYGGSLVEREDAAAVLSGSVAGLKTWTVSRRGVLASLERRIQITVDVRLKNATGDTMRTGMGVSASETYPVISGDKPATDKNRQDALLSISKQVAEAVFHRLTEDF